MKKQHVSGDSRKHRVPTVKLKAKVDPKIQKNRLQIYPLTCRAIYQPGMLFWCIPANHITAQKEACILLIDDRVY